MDTTNYGGGRYLLMSFIKNWESSNGDLNWKWVKCKLWFTSKDEMDDFVKGYQHIPNYYPKEFDKDNSETWTDYCTTKLKFDK